MCIKYPRVWQNILNKMFSDKERIPEMREKTIFLTPSESLLIMATDLKPKGKQVTGKSEQRRRLCKTSEKRNREPARVNETFGTNWGLPSRGESDAEEKP